MSNPSDWLILFDDGDVLNDNKIRAEKIKQIVGTYMVDHFGGVFDRWIQIYSNYEEQFIDEYLQILESGSKCDYQKYLHDHMINWGTNLFSKYDLPVPSNQALLSFYRKMIDVITQQAIAPPEGIVNVLKTLYHQGYRLCTSSGKPSFELKGYLSTMQAEHYFQTLYGPDLLNYGKINSTFYSKILSASQNQPSYTIMIDDTSLFLQMAKKIGIKTIQSNSCKSNRPQSESADYLYELSHELLSIIPQITKIPLH